MTTIFDHATYRETVQRIDALQPDAPRHWGTMTPAQMLEHAARVVEEAAGKRGGRRTLLGKLIGRFFYQGYIGPKPFGRNAPTGPEFVVTGAPDFPSTKARLKAVLDEFVQNGERGCDGHVHEFFGAMSGTDWGVAQAKHLDHHLRQFGV